MIKISTALFFFFFTLISIAQKEATFWYLNGYAFDFSLGVPTTIFGTPILDGEGIATMSDKDTGHLLFYTDGKKVWNKFNILMPNSYNNGNDLCFNFSTQGALIVPVPNQKFQFYIFSIHREPPLCDYRGLEKKELRYSVVDMRLDNGKGDIIDTLKNIFISTNLTEKLIAIPHTNNKDFWLLTHEWRNNTFDIRLITETGIKLEKVLSIGSIHGNWNNNPDSLNSDIQQRKGALKASPNGKKLACAIDQNAFELFDFDAGTGNISNHINLGINSTSKTVVNISGVSFSPDNSKLYVTTSYLDRSVQKKQTKRDDIRQYDLSSGISQNIIASGKSIIVDNPKILKSSDTFFNWGDDIPLQLGIDGRLYSNISQTPVDCFFTNHPSVVIQRPNKPGYDCEISFQNLGFNFFNGSLSFPNFIQSYFNGIIATSHLKNDYNLPFSIFPNPTDGSFQVSFNEGCFEAYTLKIITITGVIYKELFIDTQLSEKINVQSLPFGLYIIDITSKNDHITKKLIKI